MTTTKRERNLNYLVWQCIETSTSVFTPCTPLEANRLAEGFCEPEWTEEFPYYLSKADEDIVAGNVHRFDNVDSMLESLKETD